MTEKVLVGCMIAFFGWLLKISYDQRKFMGNCLTEIRLQLRELSVRMKAAEDDIKTLFKIK